MLIRQFVIVILCMLPLRFLVAGPVTAQQQQAARDRVSQLEGQKQQLQSQINNNNSQIGQNTLSIMALGVKIVAAGWGNVSSSGIPTDIDAAIKVANLKDDMNRLRRQNRDLGTANQNLHSQIQAVDNQIAEQNSIINTPTREELETDLNNYDQGKFKALVFSQIDDIVFNYNKSIIEEFSSKYGTKEDGRKVFEYVMNSPIKGFNKQHESMVNFILHLIDDICSVNSIYHGNTERYWAILNSYSAAVSSTLVDIEKTYSLFNGDLEKLVKNLNK